MVGYDELEQQRLDKIQKLRARGVDPYPVRFDRLATAEQLHAAHGAIEPGTETTSTTSVAGRIMLKRSQGKLGFAQLRDGTGEIQLFLQAGSTPDDVKTFFDEELDLGDWVGAEGQIVKTKRGELSVRIEQLVLLSKSIRPLPEKWHGLKDVEQRYRRRYVDLAVNADARKIAQLRSRAVKNIRDFMEGRGFVEVETPMLQSQPGGAIAKPFKTHLNALDIDLYLRIAPELYLKRLLVAGFERVFEINRNFRNEGVSTVHNPEFTMLEAYQAYGDYTDMMELTESMIKSIVGKDSIDYQGRPVQLKSEWRRASMLELVREATSEPQLSYEWSVEKVREICERTGVPYDPKWGVGKLVVELFEKHVERTLWDPTFVIDFPKEVSPLARVHRGDPNVTERFELFAAGTFELGNAFSELNDPVDQRRRFEEQAKARAAGDDEAMTVDEDYLRALEYGMPPAGGLGIGIDRLVMLLADVTSIREVILFPFMRPESQE